eukprot:m.40489 g.40489  ORF g.40489 m.40489 type:complete len:403 (+) comp11370_c0_seq2:738-1946(+)
MGDTNEALSTDNQRGLLLALSSSAFIGSSFIVKKKGLIRARRSGNAASDGGHAYLFESLWWIGLFTMVFGELANFAAYAFAPAMLVTPLGALSVIVSAVLAHYMLDEKLLLLGKIGCVLCIVGSTVIVLNAPDEPEVESVTEITDKMMTAPFQLYSFFVLCVAVYLIFFVAPRHGRSNIMVYVFICSLVGSLSVIGVKGLGIALKLTFEGNNQLIHPSTWGLVALVVTAIVVQMNYLNKALDTFNTALVSPIYYVLFTTFTIIASAILFNGWGQGGADVDDASKIVAKPTQNCTELVKELNQQLSDGEAAAAAYGAPNFVSALCGFLTICTGVLLLHMSREQAAHDGRSMSGAQLLHELSSGRRGNDDGMPDEDGECIPMQDLHESSIDDDNTRLLVSGREN